MLAITMLFSSAALPVSAAENNPLHGYGTACANVEHGDRSSTSSVSVGTGSDCVDDISQGPQVAPLTTVNSKKDAAKKLWTLAKAAAIDIAIWMAVDTAMDSLPDNSDENPEPEPEPEPDQCNQNVEEQACFPH